MAEKRFNGRWIRLVARLGVAVIEHPEIVDAIEGMLGIGGVNTQAIEQQPQALQSKPRKAKASTNRPTGKKVDPAELQSVVNNAVAAHGEVSKIVAVIRDRLGDVPPKAIAAALAAAGLTVKPNYISILLCKLRKTNA